MGGFQITFALKGHIMTISNIVSKTKSFFVKEKKIITNSVSAVAITGSLYIADSAMAAYVPPTVVLETMLDSAALATSLLTLLGGAFAIAVGIGLSFMGARKLVTWLKRAF